MPFPLSSAKNGVVSFPAALGETPWEMCLWAEHPQSSPLLSAPNVPAIPHRLIPERGGQVPFPEVKGRGSNGEKRIPIWAPRAKLPGFASWEAGALVCEEDFKAGPPVVAADWGSSSYRKGRPGPRTPDLVPSRQTCSGESRCPGQEIDRPPWEGSPEIMPVPQDSWSAGGIPWVKEFQEEQGP